MLLYASILTFQCINLLELLLLMKLRLIIKRNKMKLLQVTYNKKMTSKASLKNFGCKTKAKNHQFIMTISKQVLRVTYIFGLRQALYYYDVQNTD